ncbi:hypothetical protein LX36DRAFT_739715, partial [Colletotrichum falcatum]
MGNVTIISVSCLCLARNGYCIDRLCYPLDYAGVFVILDYSEVGPRNRRESQNGLDPFRSLHSSLQGRVLLYRCVPTLRS